MSDSYLHSAPRPFSIMKYSISSSALHAGRLAGSTSQNFIFFFICPNISVSLVRPFFLLLKPSNHSMLSSEQRAYIQTAMHHHVILLMHSRRAIVSVISLVVVTSTLNLLLSLVPLTRQLQYLRLPLALRRKYVPNSHIIETTGSVWAVAHVTSFANQTLLHNISASMTRKS